MKIALCLHGVVGNIYTDKDNYVWTRDVDYRIGLEHYQRRLFSVNDAEIDVFIHSWSTAYEEQLRRDYKPKKWLFEEQIDFGKETRARNFCKSRWYSTKAAVALKRAYEQEQDFEYDWVVLSRFDLALFKDMVLSKYDPNMFYPGHHEWSPDKIFIEQEPIFCDYFYYAASRKMDAFSTLYDHWERYELYNAHWESYMQAKRLGFALRSDFMLGRDFELVRFVYEDCHYREGEYPGEEALVRSADYPIERFPM